MIWPPRAQTSSIIVSRNLLYAWIGDSCACGSQRDIITWRKWSHVIKARDGRVESRDGNEITWSHRVCRSAPWYWIIFRREISQYDSKVRNSNKPFLPHKVWQLTNILIHILPSTYTLKCIDEKESTLFYGWVDRNMTRTNDTSTRRLHTNYIVKMNILKQWD